jgi:hypothetical protein
MPMSRPPLIVCSSVSLPAEIYLPWKSEHREGSSVLYGDSRAADVLELPKDWLQSACCQSNPDCGPTISDTRPYLLETKPCRKPRSSCVVFLTLATQSYSLPPASCIFLFIASAPSSSALRLSACLPSSFSTLSISVAAFFAFLMEWVIWVSSVKRSGFCRQCQTITTDPIFNRLFRLLDSSLTLFDFQKGVGLFLSRLGQTTVVALLNISAFTTALTTALCNSESLSFASSTLLVDALISSVRWYSRHSI